jgi:hypothetical protein
MPRFFFLEPKVIFGEYDSLLGQKWFAIQHHHHHTTVACIGTGTYVQFGTDISSAGKLYARYRMYPRTPVSSGKLYARYRMYPRTPVDQ